MRDAAQGPGILAPFGNFYIRASNPRTSKGFFGTAPGWNKPERSVALACVGDIGAGVEEDGHALVLVGFGSSDDGNVWHTGFGIASPLICEY
jgi:hypothetical protein